MGVMDHGRLLIEEHTFRSQLHVCLTQSLMCLYWHSSCCLSDCHFVSSTLNRILIVFRLLLDRGSQVDSYGVNAFLKWLVFTTAKHD